MDQSIVNMARNGKLPLPLLSGFQMSPGMESSMNIGVPTTGNIFESRFQKTNDQQLPNNSKLTGGSKNYFLKKKH